MRHERLRRAALLLVLLMACSTPAWGLPHDGASAASSERSLGEGVVSGAAADLGWGVMAVDLPAAEGATAPPLEEQQQGRRFVPVPSRGRPLAAGWCAVDAPELGCDAGVAFALLVWRWRGHGLHLAVPVVFMGPNTGGLGAAISLDEEGRFSVGLGWAVVYGDGGVDTSEGALVVGATFKP